MYHLTSAMVAVYSFNETRTGGANADMLQTLTKPFTELIVQVNIGPTLLKHYSSFTYLCNLGAISFALYTPQMFYTTIY